MKEYVVYVVEIVPLVFVVRVSVHDLVEFYGNVPDQAGPVAAVSEQVMTRYEA